MKMLAIRVANILGKPFGVNPFPRAFDNPTLAGDRDRGQAFKQIFERNGWGSQESVSGVGSDKSYAVAYARRLKDYLPQLAPTLSFFDAPCGDLNWILPAVEGNHFIGGDIVPELIAGLEAQHPGLDLRVFDICSDVFPAADVWHCRDCLFHLPISDIWSAFENFARSSVGFAMLTTHKTRLLHNNLDIQAGGFRYLDLTKPPFSLPKPVHLLKDFRLGRDFPRYVGVWRRDQIAARLVRTAL